MVGMVGVVEVVEGRESIEGSYHVADHSKNSV